MKSRALFLIITGVVVFGVFFRTEKNTAWAANYFCPENVTVGGVLGGETSSDPAPGGLSLDGCLSFCQSNNADACNWGQGSLEPNNPDKMCSSIHGDNLSVYYYHDPVPVPYTYDGVPFLGWSYARPQNSPCASTVEPPLPTGNDADLSSDLRTERAKYGDKISHEQAAKILDIVTWNHRNEGWGLLSKPGGNNCPLGPTLISCDYLFNKNSQNTYDVFLSGPGICNGVSGAGPSEVGWNFQGQEDLSRWVAPIDPSEVLDGMGDDVDIPDGTDCGDEKMTITNVWPTSAVPVQEIIITGTHLITNVTLQSATSDSSDVYRAAGTINSDLTSLTIQLPNDIVSGLYSVQMARPDGTIASSSQKITVTGVANFLPSRNLPIPNNGLPKDIGQLISAIFVWSLSIIGLVIFVRFFYAGFLWFTNAGSGDRANRAKTIMKNAVYGALVLFSAWLILNTINPDLVSNTLTLPGLPAGTSSSPGGGGGGGGGGTVTCNNGVCSNGVAGVCTSANQCATATFTCNSNNQCVRSINGNHPDAACDGACSPPSGQ